MGGLYEKLVGAGVVIFDYGHYRGHTGNQPKAADFKRVCTVRLNTHLLYKNFVLLILKNINC